MTASHLVFAPSWIGDAVMSLGALRAFKAARPGDRLTVLVRPWVGELYRACESVDDILIYDPAGDHHGIAGFFRAAATIRRGGFDSVLLFPNAFRAAALVWAAGVPERLGYATDGRGFLLTEAVPPAPRPFGRHQSYYYLDLVEALGVDRSSSTPDGRLASSDSMKAAGERLLREAGWRDGRSLVGIHPGATNSRAKRWFPGRYAEVAEMLLASHRVQVVLLGGPGETELTGEVAARLSEPALTLAGRTSLGELIGVVSTLSLLLTNDSGPMHLGAALGTPTVAVFGPTDERETGPFSDAAVVVREQVDCSPCLLRDCPIDHRCMERVEADRVYDRAVELLGESHPLAETVTR